MNIKDKIIQTGFQQYEEWEQAQEDRLMELENSLFDDDDLDEEEIEKRLDRAREEIDIRRETGCFTLPFTIGLSANDIKTLDALAQRTGTTNERLARKFIMDSAEDMVDAFIAEDVIDGMRSGRDRTYTHEEVFGKGGLLDDRRKDGITS